MLIMQIECNKMGTMAFRMLNDIDYGSIHPRCRFGNPPTPSHKP